jgi:hypothetical protein
MGIFSKLPIFGDEAVAKGTRKIMMQSYYLVKNDQPNMPEQWYLKMALGRRFRNWPDMKLEVFVMDCLNIDDLIDKIILQEKQRII